MGSQEGAQWHHAPIKGLAGGGVGYPHLSIPPLIYHPIYKYIS
jgi:hypothetical protein